MILFLKCITITRRNLMQPCLYILIKQFIPNNESVWFTGIYIKGKSCKIYAIIYCNFYTQTQYQRRRKVCNGQWSSLAIYYPRPIAPENFAFDCLHQPAGTGIPGDVFGSPLPLNSLRRQLFIVIVFS